MPASTGELVMHEPKYQHWKRELLTAHQVLRRSLERIIELSPTIEAKQKKHFIRFCKTFLGVLHEHHSIEDDICFPLLVGPCNIQAEVDKLEEEHDTLVKLMENLESLLELPFNSTNIQAAAIALKETMFAHLAFEESVLQEDVLSRVDPAIFDQMFERHQGVIKKTDPFTFLPFFISHLTPDEADFMIFNNAPWLLKHLLLPMVFSRKHKKAWALAAKPQPAVVAAVVAC